MSRHLDRLFVYTANARATHGWLRAGATFIRCAIGRSGVTRFKREGDGATPAGGFKLLDMRFRADKLAAPISILPRRPIRRDDGWCDDAQAANYNRPVKLPSRSSHEKMWRDDGLYDVVIVLDYNLAPRRKGAGSAIFFHCARKDYAPTEGCVAISLADMRRLLPRLSRRAVMRIG